MEEVAAQLQAQIEQLQQVISLLEEQRCNQWTEGYLDGIAAETACAYRRVGGSDNAV